MPPQVLGSWLRDSVFAVSGAHLDPASLFLSEQDGNSIIGTGYATGVDVPIRITITGSRTPTGFDLMLSYDLGTNVTAHFTAALQPDRSLRGRAVYSPEFNGGGSDSLLLSRAALLLPD